MKKILVLSRQTMFGEGIKTLLSMENEIEMADPVSDIETAVKSIQSNTPDFVILNCDDPEPDMTPAILCILRDRMGVSVIGISLHDNSICIHRGERKEISQLEDLLDAIHTEK